MSAPEAQSQAVATSDPVKELVTQIRSDGFQQQVQLALPDHVPARRFVRATLTALMQNPDIAEAEPNSIFNSVLRCAQDGLMPDGREAALVVYRTKDGPKAQYLPMISGYRKIAADHGWTLRTGVVYDGDEFEYELGEEPHLTHRPPRPGLERGKAIAAYAVARHKDHPPEFAVFDAAEIEKVRQTSRSKDSGPWVTWWDRMAEKTVGKYLFKRLPLGEHDERVMRIIAADETPPVEAATLIYGGGPRRAIEASAPSAEEPVQQPAQGDAGAAAASTAASTGEDGPAESGAAAPAPDEEPEEPTFEPADQAEAEGAFVPPDERAQTIARNAAEAGLVRFTKGIHKGMTIAQVHEELTAVGKDGAAQGESYIRYCVRRWKSEPEKSALAAYCAHHWPDALAEGQPA